MNNDEKEQTTVKYDYEKPFLSEETEMVFTKEIWEQFSDGNWCFGCTNCNCN